MQRWKILAAVALVGLGFASGASAKTEKAIVAGGGFWCVESDFEPVAGVIDVVSGYTGGDLANPTYENHEGHYEAVEITFDSSKISYDELIAKFLRSVDVTDDGGQFCDRGSAYRTAIFAGNAAQEASAKAAIAEAAARAEAAKRNPNTELELRADESVPYGRIVETMGLAQKAGLSSIGFVAQTPSPPKR
mgnify:CR=1 FL=1